MNKKKYFLKLC